MAQPECSEKLSQAISSSDGCALKSLLDSNPKSSRALTVRHPDRGNRTLLRDALERGSSSTVEAALSSVFSRLAALSASSSSTTNGEAHASSSSEALGELLETLKSEISVVVRSERSLRLPFTIERKETLELLSNYQLTTEAQSFARVELGVEAVRRGTFVAVQDDQSRENEGDLIMAAEHMTTELAAFMIRYTSGVICTPMTSSRCEELELPQMVPANTEKHQTAFTVSVDYNQGTSTGISAGDRALTIRSLANPSTKPGDFNRPGHIFPLRARDGGVLERNGHTEASIDLCKLADCAPVGCICEIANTDGSMMRTDDLIDFCRDHLIPMLTIVDLQRYIRANQKN